MGSVMAPRPLAVKLRNCRLSIDLEARNALWATFEHIFAALQLIKYASRWLQLTVYKLTNLIGVPFHRA